MDEQYWQSKELYAAFGLVMLQSQCIERNLAMLLVAAQAGDASSICSPCLGNLYDKAFKKTLGQLLALARQKISVSADLDLRLISALEKRNFLTHNYFWERTSEIQTVVGKAKMISELKKISREFYELDMELTPITREMGQSLGYSAERVQELL